MAPDPHYLRHSRQPADDVEVVDDDMSGERGIGLHDDVIADDTVMRDMGADHEQAIVADARHHPPALGAGIHGDVFADPVIGADHERRILAAILEILRDVPDRRSEEHTSELQSLMRISYAVF